MTTDQCRIAVELQGQRTWLRQAVAAAEAEIVEVEQAQGLVWGDALAVEGLQALLERGPGLQR